MSRLRAILVVAAAALAASAAPLPPAQAAGECNGIPTCIAVAGPWVAVPASGEAEFLLVCPNRAGIVGGTDALVSSQAIHVSFDGSPASPISPGRTTNFELLFRALATDHKAGFFEPFIGCIPTSSSVRQTTGIAATIGPPLDLRASNVSLRPGAQTSVSLGCPQGERLIDGWFATAFGTVAAPRAGLQAAVSVEAGQRRGVALAAIRASSALPRSAHALVQLGVRCTPS